MSSPDQDLVTSEGVDEGSAASTAEDADSGSPSGLLGPPPAHTSGETSAAPDDMESEESRAARDAVGTGQQLQAGEG